VWQKGGNPGAGNGSFADTLYLDFHRQTRGFGFIEAPKGLAFDQLKEAPAGNAYQCRSTKAEKGLTLFCRVNGDRPEASGYGKIVIEEITETPPAGIKIIDGQ
jgi:hypothetical protein